jgi:Rrf2 family protein
MARLFSLSEAASIALHGLVLIAKSKESLNVVDIAVRIDSSKHHVAKVLQRLVKAGYLTSRRGPGGGFHLKMSPEDIDLLEIYETIEGEINITECPLDKPVCPFDKCIINNITGKMTSEFKDYLKSQTLKMFL